jgi:hypothetical protein
VISGGGGRRRWSEDEKAQAIEASLASGAVVSEIAGAHGIAPQLFGWGRGTLPRAAPKKAPRQERQKGQNSTRGKFSAPRVTLGHAGDFSNRHTKKPRNAVGRRGAVLYADPRQGVTVPWR